MSTIGNGRTLPMTGWLLPWLKKNLIYCAELVDHYITGVRCWSKNEAQEELFSVRY